MRGFLTNDGCPGAVGQHGLPALHVAVSTPLVFRALVVRVVAEVHDQVRVVLQKTSAVKPEWETLLTFLLTFPLRFLVTFRRFIYTYAPWSAPLPARTPHGGASYVQTGRWAEETELTATHG